eukprot:gene9678-11874_t
MSENTSYDTNLFNGKIFFGYFFTIKSGSFEPDLTGERLCPYVDNDRYFKLAYPNDPRVLVDFIYVTQSEWGKQAWVQKTKSLFKYYKIEDYQCYHPVSYQNVSLKVFDHNTGFQPLEFRIDSDNYIYIVQLNDYLCIHRTDQHTYLGVGGELGELDLQERNFPPILESLVKSGKSKGAVDLLEYLHSSEHRPKLNRFLSRNSMGFKGAIDIVMSKEVRDWLTAHKTTYEYSVEIKLLLMEYAIRMGCLDLVKLVIQQYFCGAYSLSFINMAIQYGNNLEIVKYLESKTIPLGNGYHMTMYLPLLIGSPMCNVEIFEYIFDRCGYGEKFRSDTLDVPLPIIKLLWENPKYSWFKPHLQNIKDDQLLKCYFGDINIVKYLHQHQIIIFSQHSMDVAARNGYLDIVKFLHLNRTEGCTSLAIQQACKNGHYEVTKYLFENYPIFINIPKGLLFGNRINDIQVQLLEYFESKVPGSISSIHFLELFDLSLNATKKMIEMKLITNPKVIRLSLTQTSIDIYKNGDLKKLQLLESLDFIRKYWEDLQIAAQHGRISMVKYLLENKQLGYRNQNIVISIKSDQTVTTFEGCPGLTPKAGSEPVCSECPGKSTCQSQSDEAKAVMKQIEIRMKVIKHKIFVLSGKGGVGKSTVSSLLAFGLATRGQKVSLLDVDICGPSIPKLMGVDSGSQKIVNSEGGWIPPKVKDHEIKVMSIAYLLNSPDSPVVWKGPRKNNIIRQFLKDTFWGRQDYLVVDTPPGTSDEHLSILSSLQQCRPDGAIIVTTPQDLSVVTVKKEINLCRKMDIPIIGIIENMSGYVCPCCDEVTDIFKSDGGKKLSEETGIPFLGKIPIDTHLGQCAEFGKCSFCPTSQQNNDSPSPTPGTQAILNIIDNLIETLK